MLKLNETLELLPGEKDTLIAEMRKFHIQPGRFGFVNDHYGFRPGYRHVLLGTSGTGKSTLARSLVVDVARNHKVLLYSSEESALDTKQMLALRGAENVHLANVTFAFERDYRKSGFLDTQAWIFETERRLLNSQAEMLFFDNITTSDFYDGRQYGQQLEFLTALDDLLHRKNIPYLVVAHTKSGIKDDQQALIGPDDVKGPRSLTGRAQFLYVYQKFTGKTKGVAEPTFGILRVLKGRGDSNIGSTYLLDYDFDKREYFGDAKISFNEFNKIYANRAKLGGRD